MRLSEKQCNFARMVGLLLVETFNTGAKVKIFRWWTTTEIQAKLVAKGLSNTMKTAHLKGLAVDLALIENNGKVFVTEWEKYKPLGIYWEGIGGVWGGRWTLKSGASDPFHFEYTRQPRV